jgi:hypothetical protein
LKGKRKLYLSQFHTENLRWRERGGGEEHQNQMELLPSEINRETRRSTKKFFLFNMLRASDLSQDLSPNYRTASGSCEKYPSSGMAT